MLIKKEDYQIPSVSEEIDFSQFVFPNDPSGKCMVHIPYNYFCIFAMKEKQKAFAEAIQEMGKVLKFNKEAIDIFKSKIEKAS